MDHSFIWRMLFLKICRFSWATLPFREMPPIGSHLPVPWKSQSQLTRSPRTVLCHLLALLPSRSWSPLGSWSWSWTQHTQTQQLEVKMLEHFYWLQQESNVTFFWQLFLNRMLMFSTDGDRKDIQVPTLSDIQLPGIFKQREQVERDRDNPLKLMEECHFKTFVLWL